MKMIVMSMPIEAISLVSLFAALESKYDSTHGEHKELYHLARG
jgi:hypothetical protein